MIFINRFVNILQQYHYDIDNLWMKVKQVRNDFLVKNDDPKCLIDQVNKIAEKYIKTNIDRVEIYLTKYSNDSDFYENITEKNLQTGAEMFTYLNFCPPKNLIKFYKELLLLKSPKQIILAMTNIMKTRKNAEKLTATKIWNKIENSLKYLKYRKIDSVTLRQMKHSYEFVNCTDKSCGEESISLGLTVSICL